MGRFPSNARIHKDSEQNKYHIINNNNVFGLIQLENIENLKLFQINYAFIQIGNVHFGSSTQTDSVYDSVCVLRLDSNLKTIII